ncbi:MAG: tripartite tricarboxylate transporter substrate binding protein [Beijerinckiaceae bacterium]|nr:tripartite tricarboxylate transporter substrate binding protein [Beijerinckiaceae bacterium]
MRAITRAFSAITIAAGLLAGAHSAGAQEFPSKPITIIVPLAAGSGMDTIARLYGDKLQHALGKPVIIDNRPGAALMLGAQALAAATPDGHTLGLATTSSLAINPVLYKQINYDPEKSFIPIALYVKSPFILAVNPDLPVKNVKELIAYARERKDLNYSSPGAGVAQHLSIEYMKAKFGLQITHVPYRNTPQSILDIASGHVQLGFIEAGAGLPLIKDGKLRALAVSSATPLPVLPDVPPFAEASGAKDFEAVSWHAILAPAGTPDAIVQKLHAEMKRIMAEPEIREKISALGLIPFDTPSPAELRTYLAAEREKWGDLVKSLGLQGSQ